MSMVAFEPLPAAEYEPRRMDALRAIAQHKQGRRMQLADDVQLLWESHRTVAHQVQEMVRMEEGDDEAVQSILDGYEELDPRPGRLTATVFVEVKDPADIKPRLRHYAGLEHAFTLHTATGAYPARIIGDHGTDEATTAVTYLAFDVPEGLDLVDAELEVSHRHLNVVETLPAGVVTQPH